VDDFFKVPQAAGLALRSFGQALGWLEPPRMVAPSLALALPKMDRQAANKHLVSGFLSQSSITLEGFQVDGCAPFWEGAGGLMAKVQLRIVQSEEVQAVFAVSARSIERAVSPGSYVASMKWISNHMEAPARSVQIQFCISEGRAVRMSITITETC
jgi:hypothetical protein